MLLRKLWRLQFSLRSLLGLLLVSGLACGWITHHIRAHQTEQLLIAQIHGSKGVSGYVAPGKSAPCRTTLPIYM